VALAGERDGAAADLGAAGDVVGRDRLAAAGLVLAAGALV